jgi:hypothetical protein
MSAKISGSGDPDMIASLPALRRAARRALELGLRTNTPVWIMRDGKIIDLAKEIRAKGKVSAKRSWDRFDRGLRCFGKDFMQDRSQPEKAEARKSLD